MRKTKIHENFRREKQFLIKNWVKLMPFLLKNNYRALNSPTVMCLVNPRANSECHRSSKRPYTAKLPLTVHNVRVKVVPPF